MTGGEKNLIVEARSALLDALAALNDHRDQVVVVGAQAVYLHTGKADIALAEFTKDSDLVLDPRSLATEPLLQEAMDRAGFSLDPQVSQPGSWMNRQGVPVDLMVPETLVKGGRRSARVPPHDKMALRKARGLEAAVIDNTEMPIVSLDPDDARVAAARVAGPAALIVAKICKLADRLRTPSRLNDKDAHDVYRLLVAIETDVLLEGMRILLSTDISAQVAQEAVTAMQEHMASGPDALFCAMAGRAESDIGDPDVVQASTVALARDLLEALDELHD